ncbi:MAG: class I SAM-dependent methyltransferase [Rhodospirillales bacterium]
MSGGGSPKGPSDHRTPAPGGSPFGLPHGSPPAAAEGDHGYRLRQACGLCHHPGLDQVLALSPSPLANAFVTPEDVERREPRLPLDLVRCRACGHIQLLQIVDRYRVFARSYDAHAASPGMTAHLRAFARHLMERFPSAGDALVVDIGANDGTFLKAFEDAGRRVQGIEPAANLAGRAVAKGIRTHAGFFLPAVADRLEEERGRAAYVTAQMAFAETEKPGELLEAVAVILARDGVFAFEVAYLGAMVEQTAFDSITHRVLDYHALGPLVRFFAANDFEIIAVDRTPPHRGSLRGIVQRLGGPYPRDPAVGELLAAEAAAGLADPATYVALGERISRKTAVIAGRLLALKAAGVRIAGYGATACATTLLSHLGLDDDLLDFVADDTPEKHGLRLPGSRVVVRPGEALYADPRPDVVLVLAWNHADAIIARHARFRAEGGRFLVPLPTLREV